MMAATDVDLPPVEEVRPVRTDTPSVSVLVPTYNTRAYVREAVGSLLQQSMTDLEVIVVDDASTDGSIEALDDLRDPRLRIARLARNVGPSRARNAGLALARAPYVALLDADDMALPTRIEKQWRVLQARPEVGLVGCLVNRIDTEGRRVVAGHDLWTLDDRALKPLMLYTSPFAAVYMLRRSAIPAHGFRAMYSEDYALAVDVAERHEVALVREALVDYRITPGGVMTSRLQQVADGAMVVQRQLLAPLGLSPSPTQERMLRRLIHFGQQERGSLDIAWLGELRRWMAELMRANDVTRRYEPAALRAASVRMWDFALLTAARKEGLRFDAEFFRLWRGLAAPGANLRLRARALAWSLIHKARARWR